MRVGDTVVAATDGLFDNVEESEIVRLVQAHANGALLHSSACVASDSDVVLCRRYSGRRPQQ